MSSASSLLGDITDSRPDRGCPSGPADKAADRPRETKTSGSKRRKTFTGCWTCRERHVKCDEQRPRCKRCVAGKFACQGYGTRLTWLTPASQRTVKGSRRTQPVAQAGPSLDIDVPTGGSFSVPRASERRDNLERRKYQDQRSRTAVATEQACPGVQQAEISVKEVVRSNQAISNLLHPALFVAVPDDAAFSLYSNDAVDSEQDTEDSNLWPNFDRSSWSLGMGHLPYNQFTEFPRKPTSGTAMYALFDELSIPRIGSPMKPFEVPSAAARERELINHWVTNLADKFVPFRSPANPFLTVVSPMVLEGSRIARTKSTCTVALFHAVCAISAAHQANLGACPSEDWLIEHHKQLSFQHLMQNMGRTDHDEQMACLATLCLWILIHFVTGTPGAWREVTKVTRDLMERISSETWGQSTTASLTYQSFSTSFAMIQAQYLGRHESLAPLKTSLPGVDMARSQIMPQRSLELLSSFNTKLMRGPDLAPDELDQLEMEFALSTPEPSTDFDTGNTDSALVHHHRSLFYYASMLYFRGNSGRRGPEKEVQSLVSRCLDHMEHIDLLQNDGNPNTWIYAVVAFEAATPELRHRARCLFSKRMSSGITTWDTLLMAVEEIWKRRDATMPGFAPEPWSRLLAELPELDVILY
ncbi:fungal-specific transcription factor domain-containing protein [Diaporthe sp. PMI_573]|nr:fungal-specific transcription factor domain-containing protein [Diaporthaceae sp. PMI_573]